MSFFGPSYNYKVYDPRNYLNKLDNENLTEDYNEGIGAAGKSSRRIIKGLDSGEDASKYLGSDFAAIDDDSAQALNQLRNGVSQRLAYGGNAGAATAAGVIADGTNQLAQQRMGAKAGAVRGLRGLAYGTFQGAKNEQDNVISDAAHLREQQLRDLIAGEGNLTHAATGGSIFGSLLRGGLRAGAALASGGTSELAMGAGRVLGALGS
jgi:hypothetical protein